MEFISLVSVVLNLQSCIPAEPEYFKNREDRLSCRFREATRQLYQAFVSIPSTTERPYWYKYDDILQIPVISEEETGLSVLDVALRLNQSPHFYQSDLIQHLGFDRESIISFLNKNHLKHTLIFPTVEGKQNSTEKPKKKGGRLEGPLMQTISYLYTRLFNEGDYEPLREGNIVEFIKRLQSALKTDEYIQERIENITNYGGYKVKMQDRVQKIRKGKTLNETFGPYNQQDVSDLLVKLRRKTPIP